MTLKAPIYLISFAGYPNFGDELIAERWLKFLAKYKPETDVWLDVREPGTVAALFKGIHPRLHVTNTVFRAMYNHLDRGGRSPADLVQNLGSPHFDMGLLELREAGTLHLLGGGFIHANWAHHRLIIDTMRTAAGISGARLLATGQGLMPFAGETFEGFDYVSVRDVPSAQILGISRGWDDAYLIESLPEPESSWNPETANLYLCVQNDALAHGVHEQMIEITRAHIKHWGIARERIHYVEAIPGDDYAGYAALRDLVSDEGFIPFAHFWRSGFTFDANQLWLTSRFHHHLIGSLHGARGVALNGNPGYYDIKHGSLIDSGSNWQLSSIGAPRLWELEDLAAPQTFILQQEQKLAEAKKIYGVN